MPKIGLTTPAMLCALLLALTVRAGAEAPTADRDSVDAARACASQAASVREAYGALAEQLKHRGDPATTETLLGQAEDALLKARAACRDDADASRSFEQLSAETEGIRRALAASR